MSNSALTVVACPSRAAHDRCDNETLSRRHIDPREQRSRILPEFAICHRPCASQVLFSLRCAFVGQGHCPGDNSCVLQDLLPVRSVSSASVKPCRRYAVSTLPPTLALTLHMHRASNCAADSHLLQTSVRLHVCSVCLPDSVAVGACAYASPDPCGREHVDTVLSRRFWHDVLYDIYFAGYCEVAAGRASASDLPCSPLPISPSHFSRRLL